MSVQKEERVRLALRLQSARLRAHLTVDDVAEGAGVLPVAINKWERGATLPSLLEFRTLIGLYGVMACEILFDVSPWELSPEQSSELARASKDFSPELRSKVDCMLAMMAKGREPVFKTPA